MEIIRLGDQVLTVRQHWRLLVAVVALTAVWFLLWTISFPHTFWFFRFWGSNVIGLPTGALAGAYWQRRHDSEFRLLTADRGVFAFVAIVFILYAIFGLSRDLASQERTLRNVRHLGSDEITSIEWDRTKSATRRTVSSEAIADFRKILAGAELFYPSHEGSLETFQIELHRRGRPRQSLRVRILERHPADLVMQFNEGFGYHDVLLTGAARWIDSIPAEPGR